MPGPVVVGSSKSVSPRIVVCADANVDAKYLSSAMPFCYDNVGVSEAVGSTPHKRLGTRPRSASKTRRSDGPAKAECNFANVIGDDSDSVASVASAKVLYDTMHKAVMDVARDVLIPDIDTKIDNAVARELANASVVSENSLRGRHVGDRAAADSPIDLSCSKLAVRKSPVHLDVVANTVYDQPRNVSESVANTAYFGDVPGRSLNASRQTPSPSSSKQLEPMYHGQGMGGDRRSPSLANIDVDCNAMCFANQSACVSRGEMRKTAAPSFVVGNSELARPSTPTVRPDHSRTATDHKVCEMRCAIANVVCEFAKVLLCTIGYSRLRTRHPLVPMLRNRFASICNPIMMVMNRQAVKLKIANRNLKTLLLSDLGTARHIIQGDLMKVRQKLIQTAMLVNTVLAA